MQREINNKAEMNDEKEETEVGVIVTSPAPSQLAQVQRLQQGEPTERASEQDSVDSIERARLEARRESNRRSAQNGRIRQKLLIASLQDENQLLRAELGKALDRIDQLKRTLEFETQRALEHNRRVQLLVQNHLNESPLIHERPLGTTTNSGTHTIPTGSTLSRLLEMARTSYDDPSLLPPSSSSSQGNQGFSSRGSGGYSMMQDYAFSNAHTSYNPPNSANDGLVYHNNVDRNGDYASGSYSTLGDAGHASDMNSRATASTQVESRFSSNSTVDNHAHGIGNASTPSTSLAQLEHIDRLEQELEMLKRRVQG
jgi:hypothetical protein